MAHALTLRHSNRFGNVLTHFLSRNVGLPVLPEGEVFLIPFFMSNGFFVQEKIPALFGLNEFKRVENNRSLYQCDALGVDPELSTILEKMAIEACLKIGQATKDVDIILIAHGSSKNPASSEAAKLQVRALESRNQFGAVTAAFLDEAPHMEDVLSNCLREQKIGVCLGLFAAQGPHAADDVPSAIENALEKYAEKPAEEAAEKAAEESRGEIHYGGVVGTRPEIVRLIQDSISRRVESLKKDG